MNRKQKSFRLSLRVCLTVCMMFFGMALSAQNITVTGQVKDDKGEPVIGATVRVKGQQGGTVTDYDGNYTIKCAPNATLDFNSLGYTAQSIAVGGKTHINVVMKDSSTDLGEVVVVGYGTRRKGDLTGALTNLRPLDEDAMKAASLDNLLDGKVAGLVVNTASSTVGAASSVTIRGASSLRGDNQPLYVIDNVPQASTGEFAESAFGSGDFQIAQDPLSSLNPADIEDITILKDASSTAIYGSRGANGVILITTKKGKAGKAKVNVSANFTLANAAKLLDVIDLNQHAAYVNSRYGDTDEVPFHIVGDEVRYVFTGAYGKYDANDPSTYHVVNYRNWQKEIYRTAFSQNYNVSVNGGKDNLTYYVSAGYKDMEGIVKQTSVKQGDLRTNLQADLSNTVKLTLALSGSIRSNNMMAGGSSLGGATGAVSRTALDYAPFQMPDGDPSFSNENKTTVLSWLNDYVDDTTDKQFKASLDLQWNILKNLRYNLRTGGNLNMNDRKRWYGLQLYQGMNNQGYLGITDLDKSNYSVENVFTYNTKFGEDINFDATVGFTYEDYNFLSKSTMATNFSFFELRENGLHMASNVQIGTPVQKDYQLMSYLGRVNLSLWDRFLITASLRADGSSKFAKGHRWGYFPSASVAWRVEQEEFAKKWEWLDQLKVRLSYGVTGNQSIDPYSTFSMYGSQDFVFYADGAGNITNAFSVTNLSNSGLTWEKTHSWNLGFDFQVIKRRLGGTIDIYQKKTTDLLISRTLPGSAGFASTYYNQGSMNNKGVEVTLNAQIIDQKDWKWNVKGNIGFNKPEITELGLDPTDFGSLGSRIGYYGNSLGDHFGTAHVFLEGEAPGLFYGYKTQGIVKTADIDTDGNVTYTKEDGTTGTYNKFLNATPSAGDIKYVDVNGDGVVDANDRTIIGDPNPDFTYGFSTSVSWKDLTFSASFIGVPGRDILNTNNRYIGLTGNRSPSVLTKAYEDMWSTSNENGYYPRSTWVVQNYVIDRYVEDASYLRCSDITLSYMLPKTWMKKIGFNNISVYATVKNLFCITNYSGYDPEVNSFAFDGLRPGVDMSSYPTPRQYILGMNFNF